MSDSVTVHFDGKKYLVLNQNTDSWGEGETLDEAYTFYTKKNSEKINLAIGKSPTRDLSLIWLLHRNKILFVLVLFAIVYAQAAVFLIQCQPLIGKRLPHRLSTFIPL